jgi:hypothetical protein
MRKKDKGLTCDGSVSVADDFKVGIRTTKIHAAVQAKIKNVRIGTEGP